jgi:DNA-binding PadR family transcriptional regulator
VTEQALFILAALAGGELHGYGIAREARELSRGAVTLSAGTLYGAINRLTAQGLIEQTREEEVGGRLRRYYELTADGAQALSTESVRIRATADAVGARAALVISPRPRLA